MDSQTLIAILGVLGTFIVPFIVPFIVLYIERYSENRIYIKVSSNRKKNIEGKWEGNFTDLLQGDINLGVRLEL